MEDSEIDNLLTQLKTSPSPVSRWFAGTPVRIENKSITVLFTIRKEMTDEHDIARASILSAMAEEASAIFRIHHDKETMQVRDLYIHQKAHISNSESLLVRMHLLKKGDVCQLRFRIIGQGRRTLAWGALNCVEDLF